MYRSISLICPTRISTYIWNRLGKLVIACVFALCGFVAQPAAEVCQPEYRLELIESWLNEIVEKCEFNDIPISVLIGRISYHIPICFESVERSSFVDRPKYDVSFQNITYRKLMDEVVGLDDTFQWKITPNGVINVLPRGDKDDEYSNSILNSIITELDVENVELLHLLSNGHPFGRMLKKYGLSLVHFIKTQDLMGTKKISVHLRDATIRECFNAIVKSAGDNFYWHIGDLKHRGKWKNGKEFNYRWYWIGQTYSRSPE